MTRQTRLATAVCAAAALAVPATASAASGGSIVAGPLKVKDYAMTVVASDGSKDSMSVMFTRRAGDASQTHYFTFAKGVKVTTNRSLSAARIKGSLGQYGKVDLKLTAPGSAKRGTTPKGCTGKAGTLRRGTLKGRSSSPPTRPTSTPCRRGR